MTEQDHKVYIKSKGEFFLKVNHNEFTDFEYASLTKFGHWYTGLENGDLQPLNDFQKEFIAFFKTWKPSSFPKNEKFLLWHKYKIRQRASRTSSVSYVDPTEQFNSREHPINVYADFDFDRESLGRFSNS